MLQTGFLADCVLNFYWQRSAYQKRLKYDEFLAEFITFLCIYAWRNWIVIFWQIMHAVRWFTASIIDDFCWIRRIIGISLLIIALCSKINCDCSENWYKRGSALRKCAFLFSNALLIDKQFTFGAKLLCVQCLVLVYIQRTTSKRNV